MTPRRKPQSCYVPQFATILLFHWSAVIGQFKNMLKLGVC